MDEQRVEPMTAAEYREAYPNALSVGDKWARKTLAALEERERLLAEREAHAEDARVGALVREIRKQTELRRQGPYIVKVGTGVSYGLNETGLQAALDSLRPKAPEREVGPSGWVYAPEPNGLMQRRGAGCHDLLADTLTREEEALLRSVADQPWAEAWGGHIRVLNPDRFTVCPICMAANRALWRWRYCGLAEEANTHLPTPLPDKSVYRIMRAADDRDHPLRPALVRALGGLRVRGADGKPEVRRGA